MIFIDGVRTNNETLNSGSSTAGTAQSNRLQNLNNDDIESINILKGSAATALYGTAGAPGVVVITTKKGKKAPMQVNYSTQVGVDVLSSTIGLQNEFAQGSGGIYRGSETGASGSWGPKISDLEFSTDFNYYDSTEKPRYQGMYRNTRDYTALAFNVDNQYIYDKNGFLVPKGSGNGKAAKIYDNVRPFFRDALSTLNSLSINGGVEIATYHLSTSFLNNEGNVPNEEYKRKTFNLSSSIKASDKLNFNTTLNYIRSDYDRIQQGSNTSGLLLGMYRTPISFDNANGFSHAEAVNQPSAYIFPTGKQRNYRGSGGYDNPYWVINNALRDGTVNRLFGSFQAVYNHNQWVNLNFNIGTDFTSDIRKQNFEVGSRTSSTGRLDKTEFTTFLTDVVLNLTGGGEITDKLDINYLIGVNAFSYQRTILDVTGSNFVFQGFTDLSNATNLSAAEDLLKNTQFGIVTQVEASYENTYYLTLSARQDYDSRLGIPGKEFDASDYSFLYPAVSASVLLTELLPKNDVLLFAKIRGSWAQVGGPPPFSYLTSTAYKVNTVGDGWGDNISYPINGVTGFELDNILGNAELKSELTEEIEFGVDLRFFNNRVGLDVAYYKRKVTDDILNASLARSTGHSNMWLNSGEMTGDGIEATLNLNLIEKDNFNWT